MARLVGGIGDGSVGSYIFGSIDGTICGCVGRSLGGVVGGSVGLVEGSEGSAVAIHDEGFPGGFVSGCIVLENSVA